ncbi:ACT domain-containing protein ACR11 [Sesamum angolense]|uniref:ACT domain-containing protein ACR n=1 Tax=Sesamum angolense TaxID=2727404 RepID=A0AAE1XFY3_9LAMI|nr:ACT domain-containing protein ACR11 [Sesamum angolense]
MEMKEDTQVGIGMGNSVIVQEQTAQEEHNIQNKKMVVATASLGSSFGLYKNLKAIEKELVVFREFMPKASSAAAAEDASSEEDDVIPTPVVIIDQDSDPNATIIEITFGDRLGTLLDTMNALKNLGLNVVKGNVYLDSYGRKVDDPELLEAIRLTVINNLLEYHPVFSLTKFLDLWNFGYCTYFDGFISVLKGGELIFQESSNQLAMGAAFGAMPPSEKVDVDLATHICIYDDGPEQSLLYVETADRPGYLWILSRSLPT